MVDLCEAARGRDLTSPEQVTASVVRGTMLLMFSRPPARCLMTCLRRRLELYMNGVKSQSVLILDRSETDFAQENPMLPTWNMSSVYSPTTKFALARGVPCVL